MKKFIPKEKNFLSQLSSSNNIIKETTLCHDGFFQLKNHTIQYDKFDGTQSQVHQREVLVRRPTVALLIFDPRKKRVLLTEQFRVGPLENKDDPWLYELPAGIVEVGEEPRLAIEREAFEETGYQCNAKIMIGEFYLSPGGSSEKTTLFYAETNLTKSGIHGESDENEDIKTHILSVSSAITLMQQGKLSVTTSLALMWLKANQLSEALNDH
ncbi:NUDIX domain-containing protein [Aliikangiella sp. IMCC44359]|uniref:NUDIX domain-containing protein n=1 Tax=Aliikangiella sp. IMCC44359 TaxID=3459125 RepID=UPI00403B29AC